MDKQLEKDIKNYLDSLSEEKTGRSRQKGIYGFECLVQYTDVERSLESILTDVRALPSVTIVKTEGEVKPVTKGVYVAALSIKFVPTPVGVPVGPEKRRSQILQALKRVSGINRVFKVSSRLRRQDI
tara:strand:+ start:582 stop:962 length:381 start_codon:yes stop_codon:yes gene_type:complete